jgi:hypothetical protein
LTCCLDRILYPFASAMYSTLLMKPADILKGSWMYKNSFGLSYKFPTRKDYFQCLLTA